MRNTLPLKFIGTFLLAGFLISGASADTLYVGIYNQEQILRYDSSGNAIAPTPWIGNGSASSPTDLQGEGIAVGAGYTPTAEEPVTNPVYIADIGANTVEIANANAAAGTNPIVNSSFLTGLNGVANIALSKNGQDLYVAQESGGKVSEYNALTGALIASVNFTGAHDVVVGADGSVYVTAYGTTSPPSEGVVKFDANLDVSSETQFVAQGNNGLNHATGMVVDGNGNLWVANVYTVNGSVIGAGPSTSNFVSEYSSNGTFIRTIESSGNSLYTVFGLSLGADGNIYAASFNGDEISEINTATYALTTFISLPSGDEPKYATWGSDAITYSAVPEPQAYATAILSAGILLLAFRRLRRLRVQAAL